MFSIESAVVFIVDEREKDMGIIAASNAVAEKRKTSSCQLPCQCRLHIIPAQTKCQDDRNPEPEKRITKLYSRPPSSLKPS
jgi:hypothetical protein